MQPTMSSTLKQLVLFLSLIGSLPAFCQTPLLSKDTKASIITCDTGNESYSLFGHTAIRITDSQNNLDVVYNYGAFDFKTPNFVAKFSKGDLQYFVTAHSFYDFMYQYNYEQRSVYEQELIIPLSYKQKLFNNLNAVLASDERYYTYKFIDKNCTTMVVDMINKTLGSKLIFKKTETETYRAILYPYFNNSFYEKLGTSILFGTKVDKCGINISLPLELHKTLQQTTFKNHPLCSNSESILDFKKDTSSSWWNSIYTLIVLLGLLVILNKKSIDFIYFSIMGILGLFLAFISFYSSHQELANNYNILLFNPLLLVLLYFIWLKNKKIIIKLALLNVTFLFIYLVFMLNKIHLLIVLPLIITNSILLIRIIIRNKRILS